jgi:nucleoside-diphosphate-sugar epimerase
MTTLLCFGLGYSAEHFVGLYGDGYARIIGTVRGAERADWLNRWLAGKLKVLIFDGSAQSDELAAAIRDAENILISVPASARGDPVLQVCAHALAQASHLRSVVYLSSVGVYGDHCGEWVDEKTPPNPDAPRARARLLAETQWLEYGARHDAAVAVLRLAGIYGPGQNALVQIARGTARRIVKPGQVFNRVHVADIAQAIDAAFARRATGIFNVADDEPCPPGDPIVFAAQLLGVEPPAETSFEDAAPSLSPMGLSFWQDCRRVRNAKLKDELGVALQYPTYREGLRALLATRQ